VFARASQAILTRRFGVGRTDEMLDRKHLALPKSKKPLDRAIFSVLVPNWWQFTPKLEPISSVKAELCGLSPNACGRTRPLAPPEKPFELSF